MPGFKQKLWKKNKWASRPFYAFHKGYLVFLRVYAAGAGVGKDKFLSVSLVLMKGRMMTDFIGQCMENLK